MLNKLVDVILNFIGWFQFWVVIDPTEMGVVYTLGRDTAVFNSFNGFLGSGLHFIAAFDLEEVVTANIQWDWESTPYQSLTTKDGRPIIVQAAYRYRLRPDAEKVRKNIVLLNNETSTRKMAMGAAIATAVEQATLEELRKGEVAIDTSELTEKQLKEIEDSLDEEEKDQIYTDKVKRLILKEARKELRRWGYQISHIEWLQRTDSRTYRFMQDMTTNKIQVGDVDDDE